MAVIDSITRETTAGERAEECVMSLLQRAARTIDAMWRSAQVDGSDTAAVALGEASHGVHRALIALQAEPASLRL
jgi:hypothetical protein